MSHGRLPHKSWVPFHVFWQDGEPHVEWTHLGDERFRDPFFENTIELRLRRPFNLLFRDRTPIAALGEWAEVHAGLWPDGFIFHMSRCGSTLVSQMLAALPQNIVVSEASPIERLLQATRTRHDVSEDQQIRWLRWMINALGVPRGGERRFFVKFDCWHTLALSVIRRAYPSVPWIFLYRNPIEVLMSQVREPGTQMVPGIVDPSLFGIDRAEAMRISSEEYCARLLANICEAALQNYPRGGGVLVNYRQLPGALNDTILPHFKVKYADRDRAAMLAAARRDAKSPGARFTADSEAKQKAAAPAARAACEKWLDPLYRRLENERERAS